MDVKLLSLFVYGTLKRGGANHAAYCREAVGVVPARILGRLWELPAGFPILEVPGGTRLATGSHDYPGDAALSGAFTSRIWSPIPEPPFDWIDGELMTFLDPTPTLHRMDDLEAYSPGKPSLYARVLAPVQTASGVWTGAWVYVAPGMPEPDWKAHAGTTWP